MFGKFVSHPKGDLMLVIDLRSSSVGGSLFRVDKNDVPEVLFSVREPILQNAVFDMERFLPATLKSLDFILNKVFKSGFGAPVKVFCVLSSPWYVSETRIVNFKKEKPFIFTIDIADELLKKEVELFKAEHLAKYVEAKEEIRIIELRSIKTMLNGYETREPIDQKVEEVEMTLFLSMSPEQVLQKIEASVAKYFHFESIKFSSFTMASFAVIKNMFADKSDFLLIDVGGEVTDISMVKKNVLRESVSFPIGRNFIPRGLSQNLNISNIEAESYLSMARDGHLSKELEIKISPALNNLKMEWLKHFQESLANLSKDISVPYMIYLSAEKEFMNFFGEIISSEQFNQYTLTESKFKITFLDMELLHGVVESKHEAERDPYMSIDASYINHFLIHQNKTDKI